MSKATGKVRPAWMDGSTDRSVEEEEQGANTAPAVGQDEEAATEEVHADHYEEEGTEEARQAPVEQEPLTPQPGPATDSARGLRAEPQNGEDHDNSVLSTYSGAASFGKKNMEGEDQGANTHPYRESPRSSGAAPARLKAAISSFVERISGGAIAGAGGVPGGGEAAAGGPAETPVEVERRLKRSLRETGVDGFCRLAFGSPKGGVGKSSMAYGVAGQLAYGTNLRVCLVDCDPNFGATRYMVPRPIEHSVLDLAEDAEKLHRLADLRGYVSQNEQMGLDILLNPLQAAEISTVEDLADAYERVDSVLSRFYDLVVFDLGNGFRDPAIRRLLELSDELVLVSDAEKIPNAQLPDALNYVEGLGVDLSRTTLCINHGRCRSEESEDTALLRQTHASRLRRITEVEYDPAFSQLLNDRAFHPSQLALETRLGVLTTAGVALEGLRRDATTRAYEKLISLDSQNQDRTRKGGM